MFNRETEERSELESESSLTRPGTELVSEPPLVFNKGVELDRTIGTVVAFVIPVPEPSTNCGREIRGVLFSGIFGGIIDVVFRL